MANKTWNDMFPTYNIFNLNMLYILYIIYIYYITLYIIYINISYLYNRHSTRASSNTLIFQHGIIYTLIVLFQLLNSKLQNVFNYSSA